MMRFMICFSPVSTEPVVHLNRILLSPFLIPENSGPNECKVIDRDFQQKKGGLVKQGLSVELTCLSCL